MKSMPTFSKLSMTVKAVLHDDATAVSYGLYLACSYVCILLDC